MTSPDQILAADVADVLGNLSAATGIRASDIVRGSGKAAGHVAARHAAFYLLRSKGHGATAIAEAFGTSRTGVLAALNRMTIHGRPRGMAEKARRHGRR